MPQKQTTVMKSEEVIVTNRILVKLNRLNCDEVKLANETRLYRK